MNSIRNCDRNNWHWLCNYFIVRYLWCLHEQQEAIWDYLITYLYSVAYLLALANRSSTFYIMIFLNIYNQSIPSSDGYNHRTGSLIFILMYIQLLLK
ncbi:hypothetical protein KSF78_0009331 [Schistosoma japonicum]|nr:hypothetical protein KSF78_0009331 [Schistosoma japonicum]